MVKKSKSTKRATAPTPAKKAATKKKAILKKKAAPKKAAAPMKERAVAKPTPAKKKRASAGLNLTMPLSRARRLAGDLYEAAGLAFWAEAIEAAAEPKRSDLVQLQDSICEAGDFLRTAKPHNPKHLKLFWVACLNREGLPATTPRFVSAADEEEALEIWREAFKGEYGRRRPHAWPVPGLFDTPGLHE
ncbi:hypothetical protein [Rhodoblastus sp.]|uniref:hypothetical protein n=1 Tax=Rhodoblastus sp. TaxID=1962975 RepID=UPI002615581F|nr:hypothetical protein [Rhodoblastus sp.]